MKREFLKITAIGSALILIMLFYALTGCVTQHNELVQPAEQKSEKIKWWIKAFEDPGRDKWQKPSEVVEKLNLKPGDVVADIGAGTGYFTRHFAVAVGPDGKALGLDIEPGMVKYMEEDARKLNLKNYIPLIVKTDDPGLEPASVDVVFLSNTYHHIENRVDYFKNVSKGLKPGGRVVIVDFYDKPLPVGPQAPGHKLAKDVVLKEFQQAGYYLTWSWDFLPYQYFLEFRL